MDKETLEMLRKAKRLKQKKLEISKEVRKKNSTPGKEGP